MRVYAEAAPALALRAIRGLGSDALAGVTHLVVASCTGFVAPGIDQIIAAVRSERYRFAPVRRVYIPKKNGKLRPLGLPSWSDKLVGEVVRLLLEAYYEPQFSGHSHGFRKGRGCHTALRKVQETWTGTVWFIEGDISDCLDVSSHCSFR